MGRPKKDDAAKLTATVSVRLTAADKAAYTGKVAASGLSESTFFRRAVIENKTQIVARPKASADTRRLLYVVNKAGNNLNQLAHRINADHLAGKIHADTYERLLVDLDAISLYFRATVSRAD